jgi:hypothetical protein
VLLGLVAPEIVLVIVSRSVVVTMEAAMTAIQYHAKAQLLTQTNNQASEQTTNTGGSPLEQNKLKVAG